MGKLVVFWSPCEGKSKVTSSMCAVAGMFGAEYPEYSIAISHIGSDCMELGEKLDYRCGNTIKKEVHLNFFFYIEQKQTINFTLREKKHSLYLVKECLYFVI